MKIISGKYKSKKLISLSKNTRPTANFVKEAVFNMLFKINGVVLDLFAGSGSYGFEAISRGASKLYLNDNDKLAYKSLLTNKSTLKIEEEVIITNLDYLDALNKYKKDKINFNLVFLDPPYNFSDEQLLEILKILENISEIIVLEREKNSNLIILENKEIIKNKNYGIKQIIIYQ